VKRLIYLPSAILLALVLVLGIKCSSNTGNDEVKVKRAPGAIPTLIFACELSTDSLQKLFSNPDVLPILQALHAGISLSLPDYSQDRAKIIQQLNQAGVPVTAWMVLSHEDGYYLNAGNVAQAAARFSDFEKWTEKYNLKWAGIGLDIEPGIKDFTSILGSKWKLVRTLLSRSVSRKREQQAEDAMKSYAVLIQQMRKNGYPVQTYQLLFIADERKAHSTVIERVFGVVPVRGDMEVLMVYSSFNHVGPALVYSYGKEAQVIAIGSTSAGNDSAMNAKFHPLSWEEFEKDLITASHFTHIIGVYSLEGCVFQGFLQHLKNFDWDQTVVISSKSINQVAHFRRVVGILIWILSAWIYIFIALILLLLILIWRLRIRWIKRKHLVNEIQRPSE
jgi:hypothetical protein